MLCNSTIDQFQCSSDEICKNYFCESGLFLGIIILIERFSWTRNFNSNYCPSNWRMCFLPHFQLRRAAMTTTVLTSQERCACLTTANLPDVLPVVNAFMDRCVPKTENVSVSNWSILIILIQILIKYHKNLSTKYHVDLVKKTVLKI